MTADTATIRFAVRVMHQRNRPRHNVLQQVLRIENRSL
jgi:hypothetical protein